MAVAICLKDKAAMNFIAALSFLFCLRQTISVYFFSENKNEAESKV
jgi:hypothetical protein